MCLCVYVCLSVYAVMCVYIFKCIKFACMGVCLGLSVYRCVPVCVYRYFQVCSFLDLCVCIGALVPTAPGRYRNSNTAALPLPGPAVLELSDSCHKSSLVFPYPCSSHQVLKMVGRHVMTGWEISLGLSQSGEGSTASCVAGT